MSGAADLAALAGRRRLAQALAALALVAALAPAAAAETVPVEVIEVAGDVAYLRPGRAAGVAPKTPVELGGAILVVFEATEQTAAVRLDGAVVAVGATGTADATREAAAEVARRAAPRPLDAFRDQWPDAIRPATAQRVARVPLGAGGQAGRAHVTVIGSAMGAIQRGGSAAQGELRVISSFELMQDRPLAADLDLGARMFADGATGARAPVLVRAAQLRWGSASDPRIAIGRLRYAAASIGMLDGGRASFRRGGLEVAAFGGLVPDPVSGEPATGASRFGAEASYEADDAWRPRATITASGSVWNGRADERRLAASASAGLGGLWLDMWTEAQLFSADNPWGADGVVITGAGASAIWRQRGSHLGVDLGFLRPERSLRLAASLPAGWSCSDAPGPTAADGACGADDSWTTATASAGHRGAWWSLDAVGFLGRTRGAAASFDRSGYLRGELRRGVHRLVLGGSAGHTAFASWTAGELGAGTTPSRPFDAELRYRPELLDYAASTGPVVVHGLALDLRYAASATLDLATSAVAATGADRDALVVSLTLAWRPLP